MTPPRRSPETRALSLLLGLVLTSTTTALAGPPGQTVDFNRDVQPILSDHCYACHGPDPATRKAKLRLDTRDGALRAQDPVIVPGQSGASELIRRVVSHDPQEVMPPPKSKRRPTPGQIDLLKRWVDEGAPWGRHWAYVAPGRPAVPRVTDSSWPASPVDHFVLARLEREGLSPSPEAPKEALIRRVTLDLTGLPPTPDQVAAFVADTSPDAYARVVDRLLASPRYGERLAWDWLDAARYADSNGYQGDPERTMWPWRDWVVRAFNENLPYDRLTVEQLAGDLLPGATPAQRLATGFNRNHMINGEGGRIPEETRIENVVDRVNTTATVWLGLTLGCAQCHDHKFDPFTQREYYQLFAYFNNTSEDGSGRSGQSKPVRDVATPEEAARLAELRRRVRDLAAGVLAREKDLLPAPGGSAVGDPPTAGLADALLAELKKPPDQRTADVLRQLGRHFQKRDSDYAARLGRLAAALDERARLDRALPRVMVMDELARPRETFVLVRGAYNKPGERVTIGVPASLPPLPPGAPPNRLGLAQWLVSPGNPLTARVTVNRVWQALFGTGLVKTAEDFGVQGEPPSHPELLDWLATEFVRTGWDLKALYRLLVTSATYRQASRTTAALRERDPENRLLAHGPRYRLPSWMIRDQALAASGLLVGRLGGPSVKPYQPEGVWEEATFGKKTYQPDAGEGLYRRSLYTFWRRIIGPTMFFDNSARQTCAVRSSRTNTPLHALTTLNDTTYVEAARVLAQRVLERGGSPRERLEAAFRSVTARTPTPDEVRLLAGNLERVRAHYAADRGAAERLLRVGAAPRPEHLDPVEHAAYTAVCLLLLNLDETLTKQ